MDQSSLASKSKNTDTVGNQLQQLQEENRRLKSLCLQNNIQLGGSQREIAKLVGQPSRNEVKPPKVEQGYSSPEKEQIKRFGRGYKLLERARKQNEVSELYTLKNFASFELKEEVKLTQLLGSGDSRGLASGLSISKETFDEAVTENMETFDMTFDEAVSETIEQFRRQGLDTFKDLHNE